MNRRDNIDKQIRKIEKSEEKALKILSKQRRDLSKALDENEKIITQKLGKGTPAELKLEAEIDKLTKKLESMKNEMDVIREKREGQILPLRQRSVELREKLKAVETQIEQSQLLRERRRNSQNGSYSSQLDLQAMGATSPQTPVGDPDPDSDFDFSPTSPPPAYSPYWQN